MKRILLLVGLITFCASLNLEAGTNSETPESLVPERSESQMVYFFENMGEYPEAVEFYAKTWFGNLFINEENQLVYSLPKRMDEKTSSLAFTETLVGARQAEINGMNGETGKYHLFKGEQSSHGERTNYSYVEMENVYPGIDLQLKMQIDNIEKIFVVKPDANPDNILIQMDGVDELSISNNKLLIASELGEISFTKPVAFQFIGGQKKDIEVTYVLKENLSYGFSLGEYDTNHTLFIDPLLASTFIGGTSNDNGQSLAIDNNGKLFMAGYTWSSNYPSTTGAYDETYNGGDFDAYVSRFDTTLSVLEASTFIGGSDYDMGISLAIDPATGDVYLGGTVESANFPITPGAYSNVHGGAESDLFLCKFSNDLDVLMASTYLGGNGDDVCTRVLFDELTSNVFITGHTKSTDYPTTLGAYDEVFTGAGTLSAAMISRLDTDLTTLQASTLIEGSNADEAHAIQFDNNGDILLAGYTVSLDWPVTFGAYDMTQNSNKDAFLLRMNYDLNLIMNSTFIGGGYYDWATDLLQDSDDNIYIVGHTASDDYPTTSGAYQEMFDNAVDVFISKFNEDMTSLLHSTFIGGNSWEYAYDIELDQDDYLFIAGNTYSADYPTIYGCYDTTFNGAIDVFITKIDTSLSVIPASTYIGGADFDYEEDIVLDMNNQIFFTGYTASSDYPTTAGVYNETFTGVPSTTRDAFVSKFDKNLSTEPPAIVTQPVDQTVCENTTAQFFVEATGGGNILYQWFQGNAGIYNPIIGANNDTLDLLVSLPMDGDSIYCLVANEGGMIYSDTVLLNVDEEIAADAGIDQQMCEISNTVMAATPPVSGTGMWYRISGSGIIATANDPASAITGIAVGDNEFVWEVTNGTCVTTDTVVLTQDVIIPANAGADIDICDIDFSQMNAVDPTPATGNWIINDGGAVATANDPTTNITALPYGPNSFTWEVTNGSCVDTDDIIITRDSLITADAGADQIFCEDDTTSLSANTPAPGNGMWTVISGNAVFTDPTDPATHISGLDYGDNLLEWTISNGACITSDQVNIHRDSLIIADAGTDLNLCDENYTVITAEDPTPGTGLWSVFSGNGDFAQNDQHITTVTNLDFSLNRIVWEVTNGVCISTDTLEILIDTTITAEAGFDIDICGDSATLNALNATPGTGIWSVYTGTGNIDNTASNQTFVTGLSAGSNVLHWTVTNGACESYDEIEIISDTLIVADAGLDTTVCHTSSAILNASIEAPGIGTWSLLSGNGSFADVHDPATIISNLAPEENVLIWSVESGSCMTYDSVVIYRDTLIFAQTEANFAVCDTESEINAMMPETPMYTGYWELISGSGDFADSTQMTTTVTNLSVGDNVFQWNVTNGFCTETAQLTVTRDTMIFANVMADQTLCDTDFLDISADDATPANAWWSILNGNGNIADSTAFNTTISNLAEGTTTLQWNVENGACTDQASFSITRDILIVASLDDDYAICDVRVDLDGNDPAPGVALWTVDGSANITDPTAQNTEATDLEEGENTFIYTITNGTCISSDTIVITRDIFMPADAGEDITLCQEDSITLPGDDYGMWTLESGSANVNNTSSLSGPVAIVTEIGLGENELSFTMTNGACVDVDYMTITRDSLVIADAGMDMQICDDTYATLIASEVGVGIGTWSTPDSLPFIEKPNQAYTIADDLEAGENNFVWTVENGSCISTDSVVITRKESVFLLAHPQTRTVIQGDTMMFIVEVEGDFTEFQWMRNGLELTDTLQYSGATTDTLIISRISMEDAGTFVCLISGECGDVYSNSAELFVDGGITIYPNPTDGHLNIEISRLEESYTVRVYDATGRLVIEDNSTHNRLLLDMTTLRDGMYVVSVVLENQTINYKVIKD